MSEQTTPNKPIITHYFSRGWGLFWSEPGLFIAYTALLLLASLLIHAIPILGQVIALLLCGPLFAGYFTAYRRRLQGEPIELCTFLESFRNPLPLILIGTVSTLLITLGFMLFFIPGVYLLVSYLFGIPLVVDRRRDFWEAMEESRQFVGPEWFNWFGVALILGVINLVAAIPAGLGWLLSMPFSFAVIAVAYEEQFGWKREEAPEEP